MDLLAPRSEAADAIRIDDGMPIPKSKGRGRSKGAIRIALGTLKIGQSFIVPMVHNDVRKTQQNVAAIAIRLGPLKFSSRIIEENGERIVRVWRVA